MKLPIASLVRRSAALAVLVVGVVAGTAGGASAAVPTIRASATGGAYDWITVSGTGWVANETTIQIHFDQGVIAQYACNVTANGAGTVTPQACQVPYNLKAGTYQIKAADASSSATAPGSFKLTPSIVLSDPTSGYPVWDAGAGNTVSMQGYGFGANIKSVTIGKTAVNPSTKVVGSYGEYPNTGTATFVVPANEPAGSYIVTITDNSNNFVTAPLHIFRPTLGLPTSGVSGGPFTVGAGTGWPANDTIRINLTTASVNENVCSVTSTSTGAVQAQTCNSPVPNNLGARKYSIVATDTFDAVTLSTNFSFSVLPNVALYSASQAALGSLVATVGAGNALDIYGTGFGDSVNINAVELDGAKITPFTPTTTTASGTFTNAQNGYITITIPAAEKAGSHVITVFDNAADKASATVQVYRPTATLSPSTDAANAPIVLSGAGWPGSDLINVYLITGPSVTAPLTATLVTGCYDITIPSSGVIPNTDCTVPTNLRFNTYNVEVTDRYDAVIAPITKFNLTASITLNTWIDQVSTGVVAAGEPLDVYGLGFANNIKTATIGTTHLALSGSVVVTNGAFGPATFTVPSTLSAGTYVVTVTDYGGHSASADVTVYKPTILGLSNGPPGQLEAVSGSGWEPLDTFNVYLQSGPANNPTVNVAFCYSVTTNAAGVITPETCTLPSIRTGTYNLVAEDGYGRVLSVVTTSFKVT